MWKSLLFVDNLVDNGKTQCMGWGWYLQNDIQLFVSSIILLFMYSLNKTLTKILICFLTAASLAYTFAYTMINKTHLFIHFDDASSQGTFN